ncbi:hypothetical protein X213_01814 [Mycobacterium tuberculosis BTB12-314]|nr:hypothetical protein X213_01814 [Mycobacterium tuberculosis BTB12-314]
MSPIPRIVSVSLAWAAAIGLMVPIGLAPPAMAAPCSGDAANAPPPPSAIVTDPGATALGPVRPGHGPIPTGRKPRGANDRAPLPKLGPLISALLNPGARNAAPLQQQALVPRANPGPNPAPNPPATIHHTDRGSQYTSIRFSERLAEAGIQPSVGAVGSSYDNALAETINGLYKTELIKPGKPWRSIEDVELATARWVDWFNHRRLYQYCGDVPPVELEAAYYAQRQRPAAG